MRIAALSVPIRKDLSPRRAATVVALVALYTAGVWFLWRYLPVRDPLGPGVAGGDWRSCFYPAIQAFWHASDPYAFGVYNPPWAFVLLTPFALLPPDVGAAAIFMAGVYAYTYVARKLGASWPLALLFVLCPVVLSSCYYGNIDWLVALGLLLPPEAGLFLVLLKPQLGAAMALFWLVESCRSAGWRSALRTFAPMGAALAASLLLALALQSPWPFTLSGLGSTWWNMSPWPYGIPLGLVLIAVALRQRDRRCAICASPFLTPYMGAIGLAFIPLGILPSRFKTCVALAAMWLVTGPAYLTIPGVRQILAAVWP